VDAINLQLSMERGHLGLDWVLVSPANVADRAKVEACIRRHGHSVRELEVNGVRYLPAEDGDVSALASAILRGLHQLGPKAALETVADGFELDRWTRVTAVPVLRLIWRIKTLIPGGPS